jgi:phage terminase large subunit-like protein
MQDLVNLNTQKHPCGPVVTITQSARSLNDATVAIQLLTKSGSLEYDQKNELLTWSMLNAAITRNSFDEIKCDKKPGARFKRIDPVDAIVDAHALMLLMQGDAPAVDLNNELQAYLDMMGWS